MNDEPVFRTALATLDVLIITKKDIWCEFYDSSISINKIGLKLDGVGPVDNRPSTSEHHHFVKQIYMLWG